MGEGPAAAAAAAAAAEVEDRATVGRVSTLIFSSYLVSIEV